MKSNVDERCRLYRTLSDLTKVAVVEMAKSRGLKVKSGTTKFMVIQAIMDRDYPIK